MSPAIGSDHPTAEDVKAKVQMYFAHLQGNEFGQDLIEYAISAALIAFGDGVQLEAQHPRDSFDEESKLIRAVS